MEHIAILILFYLVLGIFTGVSSGLLGIGGGALIVPGLIAIFHYENFPKDYIVHMAVATSLATIAVATLRGLFSYYRPGYYEYRGLLKKLIIGLVIGSVCGAVLGHFLHGHLLQIIFGFFLSLIALRMLTYHPSQKHHTLPGQFGLSVFSLFTGLQSGLLGLGGGTIVVPFFTYCEVERHTTQMVALAVSLITAIVGTATMMITGLHAHSLPWGTVGYVYWPGWLVVSIGTLMSVPLGTRLAHRFPVVLLRRIFAVFLLVVAIHLFWSAHLLKG